MTPASSRRPARPNRKRPISRPNFVELCRRLTDADEQVFETLWRQLGLSVDWSLAYTTIGERARRASQRGFLHLLAGGEAYQAEAPTLWDVTYRTAVAQAEVEDREVPGIAVRVRFRAEGRGPGADLVVETTRPELLAACVALVAHPGDDRYRDLVGTTATTPLFGVPVPVVAHRLADPGKGTGLAMICTFGDLTDVLWWRELQLPVRSVVDPRRPPPDRAARRRARRPGLGRAGRPDHRRGPAPGGRPAPGLGRPGRRAPAGHPPGQVLRERRPAAGDRDQPPVVHPPARPPRTAAGAGPGPGVAAAVHAHPLRALGDRPAQRLAGQPPAVLRRPRPALVPADRGRRGRPRPPDRPRRGPPAGRPVHRRARRLPGRRPGPAGRLHRRPRRVRHLGHLLAHPPDRRGLGGGPGAVRQGVPHAPAPPGPRDHPDLALLHGRPVRLRARHAALDAGGHLRLGGRPRPAQDVQVQGQRRHPDGHAGALRGRRPALLGGRGAARHRHRRRRGPDAGRPPPGRQAAQLGTVHPRAFPRTARTPGGRPSRSTWPCWPAWTRSWPSATEALEAADWTAALERVERFFWSFCDDYLELVKDRAYRPVGEPAGRAARAALRAALDVQLRLLAPYLPYACEEVWSWWRDGSVHLAPWPEPAPAGAVAADRRPLEAASLVIAALRRAKSQARLPLRTPVARAEVSGPPSWLDAVRAAETDLAAAGRVAAFGYRERPEPTGSTCGSSWPRPRRPPHERAFPRGRRGPAGPRRRPGGGRGPGGRPGARSTGSSCGHGRPSGSATSTSTPTTAPWPGPGSPSGSGSRTAGPC